MKKHIHIGYGDSATGCLKEAIEYHGLPGDDAIPSRDDFTQGPISECLTSDSISQRIEYWKSIDSVLNFGMDVEDFYLKSIQRLNNLEADEITVWVGDSCHDILATGWLLTYLEEKEVQWFIVNLAEVDKADMLQGYPVVNLAMYTPQQLDRLWKYRKKIDGDAFDYYRSTFTKACIENGTYRIQKEKEIITVNEDYYDDYILAHLSSDFEPMKIVVGRILKDGKHRISDTTVEWNIRKMIATNRIETKGKLVSLNTYSVRLKRNV